ncbi:MAG: S-layer homology domain-containing protein, partial [Ruminococcaceae bacterium]|nr:S-layer homology domain-containing protein [Oscillospiraceae bacterium]
MKRFLSSLLALIMCISMISTVFAAEMNFVDVQPDAWYYEDVKYAVENGLINGKTENLFAPASSLTGSEAIKL